MSGITGVPRMTSPLNLMATSLPVSEMHYVSPHLIKTTRCIEAWRPLSRDRHFPQHTCPRGPPSMNHEKSLQNIP